MLSVWNITSPAAGFMIALRWARVIRGSNIPLVCSGRINQVDTVVQNMIDNGSGFVKGLEQSKIHRAETERSTLGTTIATVGGDELANTNAVQVDAALSGKVSGAIPSKICREIYPYGRIGR